MDGAAAQSKETGFSWEKQNQTAYQELAAGGSPAPYYVAALMKP